MLNACAPSPSNSIVKYLSEILVHVLKMACAGMFLDTGNNMQHTIFHLGYAIFHNSEGE